MDWMRDWGTNMPDLLHDWGSNMPGWLIDWGGANGTGGIKGSLSGEGGGDGWDWGAILGGLGGLIGGMGDKSQYLDKAMEYANRVPGTVTPIYQPYMEAGQQAMGQLMPQYGQAINDPSQIQQRLGQGFEQSPGYEFNYNQSMNAANQAAGAGGMLGTPAHQQQAAELASQLANQDYANYYGRNENLYNQGLEGMGNINTMGYGASTNLADTLSQNIMNQAMIAGMMGKAKMENQGGMLGGITGIAKGIFG
jgi:hypothetical protein